MLDKEKFIECMSSLILDNAKVSKNDKLTSEVSGYSASLYNMIQICNTISERQTMLGSESIESIKIIDLIEPFITPLLLSFNSSDFNFKEYSVSSFLKSETVCNMSSDYEIENILNTYHKSVIRLENIFRGQFPTVSLASIKIRKDILPMISRLALGDGDQIYGYEGVPFIPLIVPDLQASVIYDDYAPTISTIKVVNKWFSTKKVDL